MRSLVINERPPQVMPGCAAGAGTLNGVSGMPRLVLFKRFQLQVRDHALGGAQRTRFQTMGANRSYLDFFMGFGWSISVAGLLQAFVLWQMAGIARTNPDVVKPVIAAFALATLAGGVIAWRYIFPVPALFCVFLFVPLAMAYFVAR